MSSTRHSEVGPANATYEIDWTLGEGRQDGAKATVNDDRVVIDFVIAQYRAGKDRRLVWEQHAAQRLAWVRGNQHLFWDGASKTLEDVLDPFEKAQHEKALHERHPIELNMLKRFVMTFIGLVVAKPIGWQVHPQTQDPDDIETAKLGEQLLHFYWSSGIEHGMTRFLDAMWHMYAASVVWLKPNWDPQRHFAEHMSQTKEGDADEKPHGDLVFDFVTAFELTEPEGARNITEADWIIESRLRSIEWGMARYGKKFKDVNPDSRSEEGKLHTYQMLDIPIDDSSNRTGRAPDDRVLVHEIWRPKSKTIPKGFFAVVADEQLVAKEVHPYDHGRLPFIPLQEQPDYEHFRPGCSIKDMMGLQYARNKNRSQRLAHIDHTIDPIIIKETGVKLSEHAFEVGSPHVVEVSGGNALTANRIRAWVPPPIPLDAVRIDAENRQDMEDIAGIHRTTMGRPESGSQSGKHAALMTQGDLRTNSVTRMLIEKGLSKAGQQGLSLIEQFVTEKRMLTIAGPNSAPSVRGFQGSDLTSKENRPAGAFEFNVQVTIGVEPDMVAVVAKIDLLTERGWLNPQNPADRQAVFKMLGEEFASTEDPRDMHRRNARHENELLLTKDHFPLPGDDDAVHIYEHNLFTTMAEYKKERTVDLDGNSELDDRFSLHIRVHVKQAARKAIEPQLALEEEKLALLQEFPLLAQQVERQAQQQSQQEAAGQTGRPQAAQARRSQ